MKLLNRGRGRGDGVPVPGISPDHAEGIDWDSVDWGAVRRRYPARIPDPGPFVECRNIGNVVHEWWAWDWERPLLKILADRHQRHGRWLVHAADLPMLEHLAGRLSRLEDEFERGTYDAHGEYRPSGQRLPDERTTHGRMRLALAECRRRFDTADYDVSEQESLR